MVSPAGAIANPMLRQPAAKAAEAAARAAAEEEGTGPPILFVFHLPEDVDDVGLFQLFAPYGAIRANVMRHDRGKQLSLFLFFFCIVTVFYVFFFFAFFFVYAISPLLIHQKWTFSSIFFLCACVGE